MSARHTPGPWVVVLTENNDRCEVEGGHGLIARCHNPFPFDTTWDERDANARLIAAAPDLLAALIAVEALFGHLSKDSTQLDWLDKARAAIAKATGSATSPSAEPGEAAGGGEL